MKRQKECVIDRGKRRERKGEIEREKEAYKDGWQKMWDTERQEIANFARRKKQKEKLEMREMGMT